MESAAGVVAPGPEIVVGKRPAEEDVGAFEKRVRTGSGRILVEDVKKVAEMVLVLAAMGKMRGGKGPTDAEKELMVEARARMVKVCGGFAPEDVFPRDAFGGVIEDLGLGKLKEQMLGFGPPKLSIAEKVLVSKREMEKAQNFSLPSTPHSSRLHPNYDTAVECRSASHPVRISHPDKPTHMSIPSGSFQFDPHLASDNTVNSAAFPRVDQTLLRSDGRPNGSSQPAQLQAMYSANSNGRTSTWSLQPQSVLSFKSTSDSKLPVNMSLMVGGAGGDKSGFANQMTSRKIVYQTIEGRPSQGSTNHAQQPHVGNSHVEIGKLVQKLLIPRVSEQPIWTPPSRDYMNKPLTCQMCMSTVTEIRSILVCDACEKGYHLKCLHTTNQKGVLNEEWHCGKCLALTNGKSLPPKYGRVMRNASMPNLSPNKTAVPHSSTKQTGVSNENPHGQPKAAVIGHNAMENTPEVSGDNYSNQTHGSERKESNDIKEIDDALSSGMKDDKWFSGTRSNNLMKNSSFATVSSVELCAEKTSVEKMHLDTNTSAELPMVQNSSDMFQTIINAANAGPSNQYLENHIAARDIKESHADDSSNNAKQLKEEEVVCANPSKDAPSVEAITRGSRSSSAGLHDFNWVGDPIHVLDEKIHYSSCCINEHEYKAMDHVLILLDNGKLVPSKLQAMWEDKHTSAKWVKVNPCYFPGDLPGAVGRPFGLENSEVYESTCERTLLACSIEGSCDVLTPIKFTEESKRRTRLSEQLNDQLPPLYLCKWIYDEAKGVFRDISC